MSIEAVIIEIDAEINRLTQAKELLTGNAMKPAKRGPGRPSGASKKLAPKRKRKMSAEGRAKIAAAQKARWAKIHTENSAKPAKSGKAAKAK